MPASRPISVRIVDLKRRADLNLSYGVVHRKSGDGRFEIRIGTTILAVRESNLEFMPSFGDMIDMSTVDPSQYVTYSKLGVLVDDAIKDRLRMYPKNSFDAKDLVKLGYMTPGDSISKVVLDDAFYRRMAKLRAEEQEW